MKVWVTYFLFYNGIKNNLLVSLSAAFGFSLRIKIISRLFFFFFRKVTAIINASYRKSCLLNSI